MSDDSYTIGGDVTIHMAPSTAKIMFSVVLALVPGVAVLTVTQGTRWLGLIAVAVLCAWCCEGILLALRGKRRILDTLGDGSATLSACLLVLSLPVMTPPWLVCLGVCFALLFGKQLYGGLGMNPFNPAMVGYCFLLVSFPAILGQHSNANFSFATLWQGTDAITAATILDHSRQLRIEDIPLSQLQWQSRQLLLLNLAWFLGGLWLAARQYLSWQIATACLLGIVLGALPFWFIDTDAYLDPFAQLLGGASVFGAFFIATDPVSAATTPLGRWLYGFLIGLLTVCIRNLGNFPDGFAFAVLLGNALVPLLDPLTQPKYR